jgi:hypothetical protein
MNYERPLLCGLFYLYSPSKSESMPVVATPYQLLSQETGPLLYGPTFIRQDDATHSFRFLRETGAVSLLPNR